MAAVGAVAEAALVPAAVAAAAEGDDMMLPRNPFLRLESVITMIRTIAPAVLVFALTSIAPVTAVLAADTAPKAKGVANIEQLNFASPEEAGRSLYDAMKGGDWKQIYAALREIGYKGSATVELRGGDADYIKDVSRRVDAILNGA